MLPIIFRGHDDVGFFAFALALGPGANPLSLLPGNQRSPASRYACLIVVRDYHRMSAECRDTGQWHYSHLEPEILGDVRAGRAVLVFDLSNEGPAYDAGIFELLIDWISRNELPMGRCIWLGQNRLMAASAAAHLGARAAIVDFWPYDYFVKLMAWKFSAGEGLAGGLDPSAYVDGLSNASHKDKLLLCLNATPRLSRTLAVAALHRHQLQHRSLLSFAGLRYVKAGASLFEVLRYLDHNPLLDYLRPWVHAVAHMPALRVDAFHEQGNELVDKIDPRAYQRSFFSLVTESDFAEPGIVRVTEKSVKAFCMGHPAVILGNTGSIDLMRELGFEDWGTVIDRTAESIGTPSARFESVFLEVLRQTKSIDADPQAWLDSTQEISARNHQYASSGRFLAHYAATFDQPLLACLTALIAA